MKFITLSLLIYSALLKLSLARSVCVGLGIQRFTIKSQQKGYISIEILSDSLIHLEYSSTRAIPDTASPIHTTQMIDPASYKTYCGPTKFEKHDENSFETNSIQISVHQPYLSITVYDKISEKTLTKFTPQENKLQWTKEKTKAIYGIAAAFAVDCISFFKADFGSSNGNFVGKHYKPAAVPNKNGKRFGNVMQSFDKGAATSAQFPIMYAKGDNSYQFAFFYDNVYGQEWDMTDSYTYSVSAKGTIRWYVFQGHSLQNLRKQYMRLVGAPKVPPKEYFGFQHSLYGFRSFQEMFENIEKTRMAGIPQDGMILDLYWFGGQKERWGNGDPENTRFGELEWDQDAFPNPGENIALLRKKYGVGVTLIEEPYIGKNSKMYKKLADNYALVQDYKFGPPTTIDYNPWWGIGGLIDWTAPASSLWHDCKRCALIKGCAIDMIKCTGLTQSNFTAELSGHWIDLGEPELYNDWESYFGYHDDQNSWSTDEAAVHNIYQLLSSKALYDGYTFSKIKRRAASLVRTGTSDGSILWSGDVSSYLPVLANHYGAQKHIIMAGIDFFGSDIGGFRREGVLNREILKQKGITADISFSRWLANSVFTDVPVRTHCDQTVCDLDGCHVDLSMQTNPATVGEIESNKYNIKSRYELFPYYYSLAHAANIHFEPVFLPLFLAFEDDPQVMSIGDQIMIGPFLLVAHHTNYFTTSREVYLPAGTWFDYRSHEMIMSNGQFISKSVLFEHSNNKTIHAVPVFVKAGAIIPRVYVDEYTVNNYGIRKDGREFSSQLVRVWLSNNETSSFTIYEDDGNTNGYLSNQRASTKVVYVAYGGAKWKVSFLPTQGTFPNARTSRTYAVEFILPPDLYATSATIKVGANGKMFPVEHSENIDYIRPKVSYSTIESGKGLVVFSPEFEVTTRKVFMLEF